MWYISCCLVELCCVRNTVIDYSDGQEVLQWIRTMQWTHPCSCSKSTTYQKSTTCCSISATKKLLAGKWTAWLNHWGVHAPQHSHTTKTFWLQSCSLHHCGRRSPFSKPWWSAQTSAVGSSETKGYCACPWDCPGTRLGLLNSTTFALNNSHRNSATVGTKTSMCPLGPAFCVLQGTMKIKGNILKWAGRCLCQNIQE